MKKNRYPIDFRWWDILMVFGFAIIVVGFVGEAIGSRISLMIIAFFVGAFIGLPAARWEYKSLFNTRDSYLKSSAFDFKIKYRRQKTTTQHNQYLLGVIFLVPLLSLMFGLLVYWQTVLQSLDLKWALLILIKLHGWYWIPYVLGIEFIGTYLPRILAASKLFPNKTNEEKDA